MQVSLTLSKNGVSSAINTLQVYKSELLQRVETLKDTVALEGEDFAKSVVHVNTGDLKESIHVVVDGEDRYVVADVIGSTPNGYSDHIGSRYASTENERGGEHAYMDMTAEHLHEVLPNLIVEVMSL